MRYLRIDARREHYGAEDVTTMTVAELIELLEEYDGDLPVILAHDSGYTYGGLRSWSVEEYDTEETEEQ